tara:strand:+ start:333 stop:530 length:198 start_codon:yes stop_codon:yes gene_type:complete
LLKTRQQLAPSAFQAHGNAFLDLSERSLVAQGLYDMLQLDSVLDEKLRQVHHQPLQDVGQDNDET